MAWTGQNLGKIPAEGFDWYVYLLEDDMSDPVRKQLDENFQAMGMIIGPDGLVLRGYNRDEFRESVHEAYSSIYQFGSKIQPPALLVSDIPPSKIKEGDSTALVMLFQLNEMNNVHGSIAEFLKKLMDTLGDRAAMEALKRGDSGKVSAAWGWLSQYVDLKPGLFGCSINVSRAIGGIIKAAETEFEG